ncbi:hypothetical protein SDC9_188094 [bioreactor metagenome]|uniref:Uncharacterized protein n=1 Tax=bioreactor metagenome TaxID=1076179 RepID=A0A645HPR0_9ZZZZ
MVAAGHAVTDHILGVLRGQRLAGRRVGVPVILAHGFEHPAGHRLKGPGVVGEELLQVQLIAVLDVDFVKPGPVGRGNVVRRDRLPAPEVVGHAGEGFAAGVAFGRHGLNPGLVIKPGVEFGGHEIIERGDFFGGFPALVDDVFARSPA